MGLILVCGFGVASTHQPNLHIPPLKIFLSASSKRVLFLRRRFVRPSSGPNRQREEASLVTIGFFARSCAFLCSSSTSCSSKCSSDKHLTPFRSKARWVNYSIYRWADLSNPHQIPVCSP